MRRTTAIVVATMGLCLSTAPAIAQCPGDIDGNNEVAINELVTSVGSALTGCPAVIEHSGGDNVVQFVFDANGPFFNVDQTFMISSKAPHSRWGIQYRFTNPDGGEPFVGTMFVQTGGSDGQDSVFWGSNDAVELACAGTEVGSGCRLPVNIQQGRWYRLRIWVLDGTPTVHGYGGWILDIEEGTETFIGSVRVPGPEGGADAQYDGNFSFYAGPQKSCNGVPQSTVYWAPTAANGLAVASRYEGAFSISDCAGGSIAPYDLSGVQLPGEHTIASSGVVSTLGGAPAP